MWRKVIYIHKFAPTARLRCLEPAGGCVCTSRVHQRDTLLIAAPLGWKSSILVSLLAGNLPKAPAKTLLLIMILLGGRGGMEQSIWRKQSPFLRCMPNPSDFKSNIWLMKKSLTTHGVRKCILYKLFFLTAMSSARFFPSTVPGPSQKDISKSQISWTFHWIHSSPLDCPIFFPWSMPSPHPA